MKEYLRVESGPFHLMLDATQILEIIELDMDSETGQANKIEKASDHISWRGQMIKLVNWQQILGLKPNQRINFHVVYQLSNPSQDNHAQNMVYAIDQIIGLLHLEVSDFLTLPPLPEKLALLFDKAYFDKERQIQVMCLRSELSLDTIEAYLVDNLSQQTIPTQESQNVQH